MKTISVSLIYEKPLKFCVLGIFYFTFNEINWWNNNNNNNNKSFSLLLKTNLCNTSTILLHVLWRQYCVGTQVTILTGHCTVSWMDVFVDTVHKDSPFTVFHLAVHSCGYGRLYASRQPQYIGLDSVIHKYALSVFNWNWSGRILSHQPLSIIFVRAVTPIIISHHRETGVCESDS
jgi:hypothetical protein